LLSPSNLSIRWVSERGLASGRPSGGAMPLLWAHAEFLKLLVAHEAGRPVELLRLAERRYGGSRAPRRAATKIPGKAPIIGCSCNIPEASMFFPLQITEPGLARKPR